jgi:hypothetical protein
MSEMSSQNEEKVVHNATRYARGCRCDECRKSHAGRLAEYRLRTGRTKEHKWAGQPRPKAKHGTVSKYNKGCRCDECRSANAAYARELRRKKRPAE